MKACFKKGGKVYITHISHIRATPRTMNWRPSRRNKAITRAPMTGVDAPTGIIIPQVPLILTNFIENLLTRRLVFLSLFFFKEVGRPIIFITQPKSASSMEINTNTRSQQVKSLSAQLHCAEPAQAQRSTAFRSRDSKNTGGQSKHASGSLYSLENEGIIVRRHGIGTFVALSPSSQFSTIFLLCPNHPGGWLHTQHENPDRWVLNSAPTDVYDVFDTPSTEKIRCIKRLVRADQQPVIYVDDYVAPAVRSRSPELGCLRWEYGSVFIRFT